MASFTVIYDACVLFPAALRDLLMRLAVADLCQARWTDEILDEAFRSLTKARPDLDPDRLAVTRRRLCEAIVRRQVAALKNPPGTVEMLLSRLEHQGLKRSVEKLRVSGRERLL